MARSFFLQPLLEYFYNMFHIGYFSRRGPGSRGLRPRSAGLPLPRPPASRAERVTSRVHSAPHPPAGGGCGNRRMRAGGPREALREPDAPSELTLGGRPPSFSRRAPPLSGYGGGGRWRLPPRLAQVQRMVVPRARAQPRRPTSLLPDPGPC